MILCSWRFTILKDLKGLHKMEFAVWSNSLSSLESIKQQCPLYFIHGELLTEKVNARPWVTQQASVATFSSDYYATLFFSLSFCPIPGRPRTPLIVRFSALPKLWATVFTGTTRAERNEPCFSSTGLCSFTDTDLRLHFWRMNLWETDHFNLKISLKICEVCWLPARTVWIFFFFSSLRHHALVLPLWKWQLARENNV